MPYDLFSSCSWMKNCKLSYLPVLFRKEVVFFGLDSQAIGKRCIEWKACKIGFELDFFKIRFHLHILNLGNTEAFDLVNKLYRSLVLFCNTLHVMWFLGLLENIYNPKANYSIHLCVICTYVVFITFGCAANFFYPGPLNLMRLKHYSTRLYN